MEELKGTKRFRDNSEEPEPESGVNLPAVKRLRENLLDSLDDDVEFCSTTTQDLDSFMKSFEEEITASPSAAAAEVVDLTSESGESRLELGYLLEASDDELGLPPPPTPSTLSGVRNELIGVESESNYLGGEFWEARNLESVGFGFEETETFNGVGELLALDGLFDDSDLGFGPNGLSWRFETLPAQ